MRTYQYSTSSPLSLLLFFFNHLLKMRSICMFRVVGAYAYYNYIFIVYQLAIE